MADVHCSRCGQTREGFERPPFPGAIGARVQAGICRECWAQWLKQQTMLINEYRLTPIEPKARKFLEGEMEKFFFGPGSQAPEGFQPPK